MVVIVEIQTLLDLRHEEFREEMNS